MKNRFLLTVLFAMSSYHGMQCETWTSVEAYIAPRLGQLAVVHRDKDFFVEDEQGMHKVQRCFVDKEVRGITKEDLAKFLACGRVSVNRCGGNDFSIKAQPRLVGGGPITAAALYWVTKVGCYGTAAAATTAAVVGTGGTITAATGAVAAVGAGAATTAAGGTGAALAATAVGGAMGATAGAEAALATSAVITSAGGITGAVAAVEAASCGAFAFGMALPLP